MDRGPPSEGGDELNAMCNITIKYRVGQVAQTEEMCTRGCKIWFLVLPDMLRNTPMTKRNQGGGGGGAVYRKSCSPQSPVAQEQKDTA